MIRAGRPISLGADLAGETKWDTEAISQILKSGDVETATETLTILHQVVPDEVDALPYCQQALVHPDSKVNDLAATMLPAIGSSLAWRDIDQMEEIVRNNPEAIAWRIALLGSYFLTPTYFASARQSRRDHILWIIANRPRCAVLAMPFAFLSFTDDKDAYEQGRELWLGQLRKAPNDLALLWIASHWFFQIDLNLSEAFLKRGQMLDGHFKWSKKLGFLYFLDAKKDGRIDQEKMKQALVEYEKALSASNSGLGRDHLLLRCAEACLMLKDFDKGDSYGQQVLEAYKVSDYYFAYDLFHKANLVLGKISLERGDVEKAKRLLLMAAEEGALRQGHPLSGPYMKLALRMLELGEKGTVLEYLRKCAKVWTMPNHELDQWIRIIEEGRIPNFGPVYLIN